MGECWERKKEGIWRVIGRGIGRGLGIDGVRGYLGEGKCIIEYEMGEMGEKRWGEKKRKSWLGWCIASSIRIKGL